MLLRSVGKTSHDARHGVKQPTLASNQVSSKGSEFEVFTQMLPLTYCRCVALSASKVARTTQASAQGGVLSCSACEQSSSICCGLHIETYPTVHKKIVTK
eukprot:6461659-Amphidinium_carterae.1